MSAARRLGARAERVLPCLVPDSIPRPFLLPASPRHKCAPAPGPPSRPLVSMFASSPRGWSAHPTLEPLILLVYSTSPFVSLHPQGPLLAFFSDDLHRLPPFPLDIFLSSPDISTSPFYVPEALPPPPRPTILHHHLPSPPPPFPQLLTLALAAICTPWTSRAFPRPVRSPRPRLPGKTPPHHYVTPLLSRLHLSSPSPSPSPRTYSSARAYSTSPSPSKRKRGTPSADHDHNETTTTSPTTTPTPKRSELRPPKQAPSVWQIFFTDWIERIKAQQHGQNNHCDNTDGSDGSSCNGKLNVAQAAKEAGQVYSRLSDAEREVLKQRAQALKEEHDRTAAAWRRTALTPAAVARENAFRTAQRRAGKSRRRNLADPNAPRRPLSAYFVFLAAVRADERLRRAVWGDEGEPTRQSMLAAKRWCALSDEEKKPYFEQAENSKLEYEAERKAYEERIAKEAGDGGAASSAMVN